MLRHKAHEVLAASALTKSDSTSSRNRKRDRSTAELHSDSDGDSSRQSDILSTFSASSKRARHDDAKHEASASGNFTAFREKGSKALKEQGDHALLLFLVGCGIPLSVVDSEFFKHFIATIQPKYHPPSSTTLRDTLVPNEASKLNVELIKELQSVRNLTLSFDGGKIRRPRGIYTATVTTPCERQSYLLDLNDASRVSHTANYISKEVLLPVIEKIGPENVSAVVSDNTGNTRKARELIVSMFPHILNFQDCCHEINLALLQINGLDEFREVCLSAFGLRMLQDVREILSYMHHSMYAMEHYNDARKALNIRTGLSHIGTTRFWTFVTAVDSIYQGLAAFRAIVADETLSLDIASRNHLFESHSVKAVQFEICLVRYLAVTMPFARAIRCLEESTITVSDVYAFWLGIMSRLECIMSGCHRAQLSTQTMEDIRAIANQRFKELLEAGPELDVYFAAFFLDPSELLRRVPP
ncbi:hypothetical protein BN946_scf184846.g2 [Trametes cinnabarina]|uniref:DUF659 domain-containing protein n=1 Tax=Pycnoporus cinnabarinus TaxID=5643 RepID=A0A060SJZ7_PYCCI|nr:hypothetical protein BN946_scf184846.g2 [Trametes cinnabarina]